ncbi:single-stranded-DNA-specific exonuclease RecJ [Desulfococcus multivorans]|uniref:Single-stranded-DNA-specific exonuclease RecJ n=1 Tax=Desulfococcus multivorans DSM 2059 TaxID=1121405 RepID=S7U787_DESML|nr:single-stranded-DNA-specific exonuclease RecJ [Desulfococcus multivorans]AOY59202.1 RecJ: single.stranded-DNA-specific exonuclease [Desulfococcus multivorans]EPR45010.1 single-stranded-DNA-specific exonuclease RecJ [Desulfococcus multivorans DSM 2059]SJZ85603.1 single-stranded-DNA-specific exonuclease [Desulfococcus multivorans DSM 2059]
MKTEWLLKHPDPIAVKALQTDLGCSPVIAAVLVNRNILTGCEAVNFLEASLKDFHPPSCIVDMDTAVRRIARAVSNREKILIFGDYDVDGVTAVTLLLEFLRYAGADVIYYIPHRTREGYDFQEDHVFGVALPAEVDLIVTVDCGSSRHDAVQAALDSGIDVVITDHHTIEALPPAVAVVNPRRRDCGGGCDHLAGVGVVFSLLIHLRKHLRDIDFWGCRPEPNLKRFCDLVALGTVADMVPMIKENRILSRTGLDVINQGHRSGLRALVRMSGIKDRPVDTDDIAFRLGPRLNAAGRMGHAGLAVELLTAGSDETADQMALQLNRMNKKRQEAEKEILDQVTAYIEKHPHILDRRSIVMAHSNWHEGILGIVASKLVDRFFRPVVLISTRTSIGKGSGRSIPGINLHACLKQCAAHLKAFGGHPMAAGLRIQRENIRRFEDKFDRVVSETGHVDNFSRSLAIDCKLDFEDITGTLLNELERLTPFGEGNPEPLFMTSDVRVVAHRIVGKQHRKMTLIQAGNPVGTVVEAIQFNIDPSERPESFEKIAYHLRWNRWNGKQTPQILVKES